jgi:hypothetical protein
MAKRHEVFPTRGLAAADLNGKPATLTIVRAPIETLKNKNGEDTKTVLYFRETQKVLPLNRTNWDSCADICGDDSDDWPGHQIEIYPTTTPFGAEVVPCVRIRAPQQKELPAPEPKPKKAASAKPPPAIEVDDEIPFS